MPHIVVHLSGQSDDAINRRVVQAVAGLTQSVLGKQLPVIAITLQHIPHDRWFIGGRPLSELGQNAFHLDISVTDETNTKAEKARYIKEIYAAFQEILGELHDCSYVHVIDARAAAYGYGGRTQEYRHQHG
ncbi:4-oxalocrotonate tautomerase [Achromobacter insolitus]|uniref:4-oxalocrotonate tautomerase domain-containing protein n=1 Tax=Achromobacter insolitus TaxID=217204 RepID=A0A6S7FCD8_9BURK|nr:MULTISPECIES: 4-oxalocrotonate tautomerase [Achromobacter]GLK97732.1 4-oxalocrotonate tautomerase [Achromobacter xylosoxidans]APX76453.1 4-oxalocrotonate tautomerase [Achromobacter insolitus]AVG38126.1 4-oxalocrotonate tautomerase [Achromobacter insolitus]MCP1404759.1 4-oxalocrotonate tautomerase [Achromobacter insolitus]MDH3065886.1 4-oxalocrotonate tautomerase [Achromobacter insolitus]